MAKTSTIELTGNEPGLKELIEESKAKSEAIMKQQLDATSKAREILGYTGRMISGSKSGYSRTRPQNVPVFNSNVVTEKGKIWYGDIDLTLDEDNLKKLAEAIGQTVYVLYEMDGRFENEGAPKIDRAVLSVSPSGEVGGKILEYAERAKRGKLAGKLRYKKEYQR